MAVMAVVNAEGAISIMSGRSDIYKYPFLFAMQFPVGHYARTDHSTRTIMDKEI